MIRRFWFHFEKVLYWLSGLTCTDENFITKSGAQRAASSEGIALIAPDTSPSKFAALQPIQFLADHGLLVSLRCFTVADSAFRCKCNYIIMECIFIVTELQDGMQLCSEF